MGRADFYRHGDYNVQCERTGFKAKRSQCRKQWDNRIVLKDHWEPRQPQDFLRSKPDKQTVPDPRPEGADVFLGDNDVQASDL